MTFPFEVLGGASRELGLVLAVLTGIAFGFVLERAGFGRAPKLAAQFYLRDMTVFKVMFTAIVTAMLGLVIASGFGLADLRAVSESIASWTWVWPMLIGGLVLGAGFIISGYCPGTSIVAASSGNVDGLVAFGGVVAGTFVYSELLQIDAFARFHVAGEKGAFFLYDLFDVSPEVLAAGITVAALLAFLGAEKVERLVRGERAPRSSHRFAFATMGALAAVALITIAVPSPAPAAPAVQQSPIDFAKLVSEPWTYRLVDVRGEAAFAKARIPGSEPATRDGLEAIAAETRGRTLVIVDEKVFAAWQATPFAQAMAGVQPPPPPAARPGGVAKPKKRGGGCSA